MKKLFLALALLASTSAFALSANDSWNTIFADNNYIVSPVYPVFGPTGIFNSCYTGTEVRSIAPVKTCVETKYIPGQGEIAGETVCVREEARTVSMPRVSSTPVCVQWSNGSGETGYPECTRWENKRSEFALTQAVDVLFAGGEAYGQLAFVKSYSIPACK